MMARCKLNPCCGATMPGKCEPPPQIKPNEGWEAYEQRVASLSPAATPVSEAGGGDVAQSLRDLEEAILACERGTMSDVLANYRTVRRTVQDLRALSQSTSDGRVGE